MVTAEQNQKDIATWKTQLKVLESKFEAKPNKNTAAALSNHRRCEVLPLTKINLTFKSMYISNAIDLLLPTVI